MTGKYQLDSHKLQYHPDRVADFLAGRMVWPLYVEISPTSVCNHRCVFCNFDYLGHGAVRLPPGRMTSLADELADCGVKAVVFAGAGEPTLHPETFPAIRRCRERGVDAAMSTNGALLKTEQIRQMAETLTWVRFSIAGGTPEEYAQTHGTRREDFFLALAAISSLAEEKNRTASAITIGAQCVLTGENHRGITHLARELKARGADYFVIKHYYPHDDNAYRPDLSFRTPAFMDALRHFAEEISTDGFSMAVRSEEHLDRRRPYDTCHGLPFIVYVRENGLLYTCFSHQDDERTAVGSLLEHDFNSLWRSAGLTSSVAHINEHFDKSRCQANCRHHQINLWLHQLKNPPPHVNFI